MLGEENNIKKCISAFLLVYYRSKFSDKAYYHYWIASQPSALARLPKRTLKWPFFFFFFLIVAPSIRDDRNSYVRAVYFVKIFASWNRNDFLFSYVARVRIKWAKFAYQEYANSFYRGPFSRYALPHFWKDPLHWWQIEYLWIWHFF